MLWQTTVKKRGFDVELTQMKFKLDRDGEKNPNGGCVSDRSVCQFIISTEFLAVATDDQACFVADDVALAIGLYLEDPFSRDRSRTDRDGGEKNSFPDLTFVYRGELFVNGSLPVLPVRGGARLRNGFGRDMIGDKVGIRRGEEPSRVRSW